MKFNKWTLGLAAVGVVSLSSAVRAENAANTANTVLTSLSSTTLSGYVDASAQWNLGTGNQNTPPYAFGGAGKADGFNLNVVDVTLDKPLDESQWAAGYHVDLWFGPDAGTLATDTVYGNNGNFAIRQAYVTVRTPVGNGIDWKLGVFDTVVGYESLNSANNPHYTRSYGFTMEPTTHTGILGTYRFCDFASASVGVANTVGPIINERAFLTTMAGDSNNKKAESYKTYMGSFALTAPESMGWLAGSTLYGGIVSGFNSGGTTGGNEGDQVNYYAGATFSTPVTGLKFGTAFDYLSAGKHVNTGTGTTYNNADMWSLGFYGSFQATEKLAFMARAEYVDAFLAGRYGNGSTAQGNAITAFTGTVQYDLWKNVLSRVELRWDHADHGKVFGSDVNGLQNRENAFLIAAQLIYKF